MEVSFVKGHCGWDVLTLVPDGEIPAGEELEAALKILAPPVDGGLEVGFLGRGDGPDEIRLRMVDSTTRNWIPMCGGMSQVIGKALVETFFRDRFGVDTSRSGHVFKLITPSGAIPIHVEISNHEVTRVTTVMDQFASYCYGRGIEHLTLRDCEVLRVGDFCVFETGSLERRFPGLDFTRRDPGPHLDVVNDIMRDFRDVIQGRYGAVGMMFDARPEGCGQFRIYPRFYSDDLAAARLPYEFQCGTGTVATGLALAHLGLLPFTGDSGRVCFEWGSQRTTPDPFGIRTSDLHLELQSGRVAKASFSHSVIEIVAQGKLSL
jgi:hypothetical protein